MHHISLLHEKHTWSTCTYHFVQRFKKDLWQKSIHYEAKGKKAPLLEDEAQKVALQGNALAPLGGQRNVSVTTTALVVRMNCLSYVYDALPSIQRAMEERYGICWPVVCVVVHVEVSGQYNNTVLQLFALFNTTTTITTPFPPLYSFPL